MDYVTYEEFVQAQREFLKEFPASNSSYCIEVLINRVGLALAQRRVRQFDVSLKDKDIVNIPLDKGVVTSVLVQALVRWRLLDDLLSITKEELLSELGIG